MASAPSGWPTSTPRTRHDLVDTNRPNPPQALPSDREAVSTVHGHGIPFPVVNPVAGVATSPSPGSGGNLGHRQVEEALRR